MATLVIIRGNSGSGKTSLAKKLQEYYGRRTLVISQDIVRRDMLKEKVEQDNLSRKPLPVMAMSEICW